MEALLVSTVVVAIAEIGDKTQLLALLLVARHRAPWPIVLGIAVATIANHALASAVGNWLTQAVGAGTMRWILGGSFLLMAVWALIPDSAPGATAATPRYGVFVTTLIAFFLVEMGDKTQIATVMLAARYDALIAVTAGTTLGMMIANVPAVLLGDKAVKFVPIEWVHRIAAVVFASIGAAILAGVQV